MKNNKNVPKYDKWKRMWKVKIDGEEIQNLTLQEAASDWTKTCLLYPTEAEINGFVNHEHTFEDVLQSILWDPKSFDVPEEYKSYYSAQELELAYKFKEKVLENKGE